MLASYMLHVTNIAYSFVNVEKDEMEAVFHALQDMRLGRNRFDCRLTVDRTVSINGSKWLQSATIEKVH